jgi:hypothetical protein
LHVEKINFRDVALFTKNMLSEYNYLEGDFYQRGVYANEDIGGKNT